MQGRIDHLRIAHDVEFVVHDELVHQRVAVDQRNGSQQQSRRRDVPSCKTNHAMEARRFRRPYLQSVVFSLLPRPEES